MHTLKKTFFFVIAAVIIFYMAYLIAGCYMAYNGENLFFTEGCSQCHSFKGKGGRMGPDLSAVTNIRSDNWIYSYLQDPKMLNSHARMPSFKHLSHGKRKAIIAFLKN